MAQDMTMSVLLQPEIDSSAFNKALNQLESGLRNVKRGRHKQQESLASNLIATMVKSGLATSETQARIQLSKRMGGGFSSQADAILRAGENVARYSRTHGLLEDGNRVKSFSEKQLAKMAPKGANVYREFRKLENRLSSFQDKPTSIGAVEISGDIKSLRVDLAKLYNEYRAQGKKIPDYLRQISKNTAIMQKAVKETPTETETHKKSFGVGVGKLISSLVGIGSVASLLKKSWDAINKAVDRGMQALHLRAAYGSSASYQAARATAGMYNMSTESAISTDTYAADFRQRMLWGEISEKEIIGLSRAGKWGRMVMSGEAARNPQKARSVFESMVASTEPAKMRSILSQLGLSQELMNYRLQPYGGQDKTEMQKQWYDLADKEMQAAELMYDAGVQLKYATEAISGWMAKEGGEIVAAASPQGRRVYSRLSGKTLEQTEKELNLTTPFNKMTPFRFSDNLRMLAEYVNGGNNVSPTVQQTNNITIQGNADDRAVNEIEEATKNASVSAWMQNVKLMGGRTGFGG